MKRIERVYCEILQKILQEEKNTTTQKRLSQDCDVSIGIVNYALKPLHQMGIVEKKQRSFTTINPKKLLLYWASIRSFANEIIYSTFSEENTRDIEHMMPPCIFTAYSGYKNMFDVAPADYREIYVYGDPTTIKKRFPPTTSSINNIFVLKKDEYIEKRSKNGIAPIQLIYVDLWNLNTWYANEFIRDLDKKLGL
jgi:DNA-binding transcriptional regulator YhcF (GntR family)